MFILTGGLIIPPPPPPPNFKECQLEGETTKWEYGTQEFYPKGKETAHLFIDLNREHMTLYRNAP